VRNSTITGNTTILLSPQSGTGLGGGAVRIELHGSGSFTLSNTIVAGITFVGGSPDVVGPFIGNGNNLIGNTTGSTGFSGTDLLNVNPLLAALANNGGPTLTHAIPINSPARNAGSNTGAPATDQRGLTRIVGGTIDIGAFEFQGMNPVYAHFAFNGTELGTQTNPFNTLGEAVGAAANDAIINIAAGTSSETLEINQQLTLQSTGGIVRVGDSGARNAVPAILPQSTRGFIAPK
jgi:hypothetical protein